jgi:aspartyl-tRNA(Asn)/glutamyl-tRNA(Gln) amidotransferase subunit C
MALTRQQVEKVSLLGRLELTEAEVVAMTVQLGAVLGYVEQLSELDTTSTRPMAHAVETHNVFREDVVQPSVARSEMLANSPHGDGEYYLVPAVLGE